MYKDELRHHGVKGMKWGVRRKRISEAKKNMKSARREFNKAHNKAYGYSSRHMIGQFTNSKKKTESDSRWDEARSKGKKYDAARAKYKGEKKARKQDIKNTYKDIRRNAGLEEKLKYNKATHKKAAKYVVDHNMSYDDAMNKAHDDAIRNTGIILTAYGGLTVASLMYMNR